MKHLLITIAVLVLVGCAQLKQVSPNTGTMPSEHRTVSGDKMEFRRGLRYVKGESKPFTGKVIDYSSGLKPTIYRLKMVSTYMDGKEYGTPITSRVQNKLMIKNMKLRQEKGSKPSEKLKAKGN